MVYLISRFFRLSQVRFLIIIPISGAIDLHRSEFAVHHPSDVADDEDEDDEDEYEEDNDLEKELEEPQ